MERAVVLTICGKAAGMGILAAHVVLADAQRPVAGMLAQWAEGLSRSRPGRRGGGVLRFAFYGRVSTEDWQDPVTSHARQLQQAMMLVAGVGIIVAEFFDIGES